MSQLDSTDPEIGACLSREVERQRDTINLIASENFASRAVLEAQGSVLTNKYAEGYPGRRYYAGCREIDVAESLAVERAKKLFGAQHANVQPHSGSQANLAVYSVFLNPGDTLLAMSLAHGGHLTHGAAVNFSGRLYRLVPYGVRRDTELLDYDELEEIALKHRPQLIVAGASSYSRLLDFERFGQIAQRAGAKLMVDMAHIAGMVAAGVHPSPMPHAHAVTSTSHKTLRGPRGGFILCSGEVASQIDAAVFPGMQGGPLMHAIAAKAVAFHEAMQPEFQSYQRSVVENARVLAQELGRLGLRIVSGGTDTHLFVVDITASGITGRAAEEALEAAGIIVNRNAIPFDSRPPQTTSGIRLGTPAVTTRGFGPEEMKAVAQLIVRVISHPGDEKTKREVNRKVEELCHHFPMPGMD
ncbi:MAG: serine hydroxymethyltransferase [Dehalococcoidia bacterium]